MLLVGVTLARFARWPPALATRLPVVHRIYTLVGTQPKSAIALRELQAGCRPKDVIAGLAEDLLAHYLNKPLIDPYGIYQHLMDYWVQTMQDDCYLISAEGWKAEAVHDIETDKKGKAKNKGWRCDLIPKAFIVTRYYAKEQAAIDQLTAHQESFSAKIADLEEKQSDQDGVFADFDKVNKVNVAARLKEIKSDKQLTEDVVVLSTWLKLNAEESDLKKRIKIAEFSLDVKAFSHYQKLTEDEIQALVVDEKWIAALDAAIHSEMDRVSLQLAQRVKELAYRYETPLPRIQNRVVDMEARVSMHLEKMGFCCT